MTTEQKAEALAGKLADIAREADMYESVGAKEALLPFASALVRMGEALDYLIEAPVHPEFTGTASALDPILKHWSHTAPEEKPFLRCPRCMVESALAAYSALEKGE